MVSFLMCLGQSFAGIEAVKKDDLNNNRLKAKCLDKRLLNVSSDVEAVLFNSQ